jgi:hypothetical protein
MGFAANLFERMAPYELLENAPNGSEARADRYGQ